MADDVALNKVAAIERCLARVREEYQDQPARLENPTVEDAIVLNLQRACEAAIDLAMHAVACGRLGVPQNSRHAFTLLEESGALDAGLADRMRRMVGFRNIAVHEYEKLDRAVLRSILERHLPDFEAFCAAVLRRLRAVGD